MFPTPYVLMTASALLLAGFGANETTHGGVAEGMGLGHQHMTDHGGYHCAGPDDADWERHQEHMHDGGDHCGGDHMGRTGHHGPHGGTMQ